MPDTIISDILDQLESAPARFTAALSRLEDADSVAAGSPDDWSPAEVLAHIRASCDILALRILQILVRDDPPLPAFDERRWAEVAHYVHLPITESLATMRAGRRELMRVLRALKPEDWERAGQHEVRGRISILDIARHLAEHEGEHIVQIEQAGRLPTRGE